MKVKMQCCLVMSRTVNVSNSFYFFLILISKFLNSAGTVILWYNKTQLIAQVNQILVKDDRLAVDDNFSLHIKRAQSTDSNEYLCKLLPEQHILYVDLKVLGPPKAVKITAKGMDVTNKTIHYNPKRPGHEFNGHSLELTCNQEGGNPQGIVTWSHDSHTTRDSRLVIQEVNKKTSGLYQCLIDNKRGKPVHGSVTVVVERKYF